MFSRNVSTLGYIHAENSNQFHWTAIPFRFLYCHQPCNRIQNWIRRNLPSLCLRMFQIPGQMLGISYQIKSLILLIPLGNLQCYYIIGKDLFLHLITCKPAAM